MEEAESDAAPTGAADSAELAASLLESSTHYAMIATDGDGLVMLWNEGARRLYAYSSAEMLGRPLSVLHTEEGVRAGLPQAILKQARQDGLWDGSVDRVRKDGSRFIGRVVVTPRHANGKLVGFLLISSDITEEFGLLAKLQEARALSNSLLASAPDAMVIVDSAGEIQLTNAETETLFGYTRAELIGHAVEMLIPDRYHARHPAHRAGFFREPRVRPMGAGLELWGRRKDGVEFPVEISFSPLETAEGLLATAAIRDITELRQAAAELEAANRARDGFLASMSHELRTPLNAVLGFTGTILMELPGPLNDDQRRQLLTVQANGRHLLSLINDLLDLAKIESGKIEVIPETIACKELLEQVVVALRPLAEDKGIRLEVDTSTESLEVRTDRRALSQILINLTNNAIKFTDEGNVRLTLSRSWGMPPLTRFEVIDTGSGIRLEDQQKLFMAFKQIDALATRPTEGTGLGLYICQRLATLIGAAISLKSEFGVGTTFSLELPDQVNT